MQHRFQTRPKLMLMAAALAGCLFNGGTVQAQTMPGAAAAPPAMDRAAAEEEANTINAENPPAERPSLAHAGTIEDVFYGVAARARWVSVPGWFLDLFTKANEPLSSTAFGMEFFRRHGDYDLVLGLGWQGMSPSDGNWLGKGKVAGLDTDFVQTPGVGLVSVDFAFIRRQPFTEYFGMHYGAGLGLALVTGTIYRTSAGPFCTDANAGNESQCYPAEGGDPSRRILPGDLARTENGGADTATSPHRFVESGKPPVLPILNLTLGLDFRLPNVRGLEIRPLEVGFFNAFFVGAGIAYLL